MRSSLLIVGILGCVATLTEAVVAADKLSDTEEALVDASIVKALQYLAANQQKSGAWRNDSYGDCTAITSLSVMAFMAAGHVPDEGDYGASITRGIRWVLDHQEPNGMIVHKRSHGPMYSHGISTLMLAEAAGMVPAADADRIQRALEKAVLLILQSQAVDKDRRHAGGWRYQIDSRDSDLSVTAWQVLALRAAKDIGCDVPAEAIDLAIEYVRHCSVIDQRGFGYQPGGGRTETLTGTGITALEVCGVHSAPESLGGADFLLANPIDRDTNYVFYGVYYTGVGMFKLGGRFADGSRRALVQFLLPEQNSDGSWESPHGGERTHGRVYATSLAVLALAIEYRYLPIYQR
ncbi:MAG: prenyltransferase/squalene oxidase repeat-containing protein [Planctomycetaceae bacterium]